MADLKPPLKGLAIWLLPNATQLEQFQLLIDELAQMKGGRRFAPHATVLGLLNYPTTERDTVLAHTKEMAAMFVPLAVEATGVGVRDRHFQAVILPLVPTSLLRAAWRQATSRFVSQTNDPYFPHLSAAYGDYSDADKTGLRDHIYAKLRFPYIVHFDRLAAAQVDGHPDEWQIIEEFPLLGKMD